MYSFILIALNEEKKIESSVRSIQKSATGFDYEIIVADGGSSDKTLEILSSLNVRIVHSDQGRGLQLRRGAKEARGTIYIFLHADTLFPKNGLAIINKYYLEKGIQASTFKMGFDKKNIVYSMYSWFTTFDSVFTSFGDQCIAVTRELYQKTGGFPAWQIFEDVEFLRKVRKETKIYSLPAIVSTSARRFAENGIVKQQLKNFYMIIAFFLGIRHTTLSQIYANKKYQDKSAIVLFTRFPVAGKVKTRLAGSIGAEKAAAFYKTCCEYCFDVVKNLNSVSKYIFSADPGHKKRMRIWAGDSFLIKDQRRGNLGEKMYLASKELKKENYDKIVIIGTDIPDISFRILRQAFKAMDKSDFVIGPTYDGGYYLIGFKKINFEVFEDVDWSSDKVLQQTINKIKKMGCSYFLLEELVDIDYKNDLTAWFNQSKNNNHPVKNWIRETKVI